MTNGETKQTNEELATLIQQGHKEYLPDLWENVRRLMYKLTFQQYSAHKELFEQNGLTLEDVQQESYFAMLGAVEAYKPEKEFAFTSYLRLQLKQVIRKIVKPKDLLNREETRSLDEPLDIEEGESDTLHDVTADPTSGDKIAEFDQRESYALLHKAVSLLPGGLKEIIKLIYFDGLTLKAIGEQQGKSIEAVRQAERRALNMLRRGPISRKLKDAYFDDIRTMHEFPLAADLAYRHKGLSAFRTSGTSTVEDAFFQREAAYKRLSKGEINREEYLEILLAFSGVRAR